MLRVLDSKDGLPNYLRAILYATIIARLEGDSKMSFIKRRARRHGEALKFLAFLLSISSEAEKLAENIAKGKVEACLRGLNGGSRNETEEACKKLEEGGITSFLNVGKKEAARLISEALAFYELYKKAKGGSFNYIEDVKLAEVFGGYGNFALGAAEIGLESLYVELNPVAYFAYKAYIDPPKLEELKKSVDEILEYLRREVEKEFYIKEAYATFRSYIYKCEHCGEHIPIVAEGSGSGEGCITLGKRYRLQAIPVEDDEIPRELSRKFEVYDGVKCYYLCPLCGNHVRDPKKSRKKRHKEAVDEASVFAMPASELPRAYAVPIGYTDKKDFYYSDELFEKYKKAMLYIIENREEIEKYVPHEEILSGISGSLNVLKMIKAAGIYRRTQLMTPRQVIGFYKAIKRLKEFRGDERLRDRLAIGIIRALQTNVLGLYHKKLGKVERIAASPFYQLVKIPAELTIPGDGAFTISNLLGNLYKIVPQIRGKIEPLNEAAQKLSEHPELYKRYDFVFVDPPYLNAIPYFDLSYLYYARLKKLYGEKLPGARYTLEEIRALDLTSDVPMEYGKKLAEALRGIDYILKDEGLVFFQFAPPKSPPSVIKDGKRVKIDASDVRRATLAAILSAGFFPVIGHPVLLESGGSKEFRPGETTVKTMMLVLSKASNIESFLTEEEIELFSSYSGELSKFLEEALEKNKIGAEYVKRVLSRLGSPRIEDIPAIAYILVAPIIALNFPDASIEEIEKLLKEADRFVDSIFDFYIEKAFGVKNFTKKANEDPSYIYFLGLALGSLDIRSLKTFKIDDKSINKAETFFEKPQKASGKHVIYLRRPKMLIEIGKYTESIANLFEAAERGISLLGEKYRDFRKFLEYYKESICQGLGKYEIEDKLSKEEKLLKSLLEALPKE